MDLHGSKAYTRRRFLAEGLTLASAAIAVPRFIQSSAYGLPRPAPGLSSIPGVPEERVLVVIQLGGGNDGLNTVVPYTQAAYYRARPRIGIREDRLLRLEAGVGLHPALRDLMSLYEEGLVGIVQGVGYPNPNRSHFKSMDIWQTADTNGTGNGWLGRYFDAECCGHGKGESGAAEPDPQAGVAIGRSSPVAMQGSATMPVAFENADLFRWAGNEIDDSLAESYERITQRGVVEGFDPGSTAGFLMRTALDAQVSSDQIRRALDSAPLVRYPGNPLARQLAMVASMIRAGLRTRVYYVSLGGFDTHAGQGGEQGRHANLLSQLASSLRAFYGDLKRQGNDGRVLTMTFSEFGRRVRQNGSQGTDHGTAAPMFFAGPMARPGVIGDHPSLDHLEDGDMRYGLDFRSVYAGVLERWLKADSARILRGRFRPVELLKRT